MHERISKMLEKFDAFIALIGGYGSLEEIFQMLSWSQLNIHRKPIGLLNVNNFFDGLLSFLNHVVEQNFISHSARQLLVSASTADELIDKLQHFVHAPDLVMAHIDWSEQGTLYKPNHLFSHYIPINSIENPKEFIQTASFTSYIVGILIKTLLSSSIIQGSINS
ncbi:hypothetical protein FNV43_RR19279 [Rhamnella rubrinervis]|uniref:Cytokinin riboside 5'-monophosphate phosphoribohydrolase n=1 Tax=Rhamnella rubrinervis TaxID=2594499 RepID=A0A8K0E5E5_9ROSA|nr:hypothetical protein FNV43_RR19279 [Rhamnella rubrinervis]